MSARELTMTRTRKKLHTSATVRERVRVRGIVVQRGDSYSGTYRNVWLRIETAGGSVRVTASPSSTLGTLPVGSSVEVAARLTGLVELDADAGANTYYAERAQLLDWAADALR